MKKEVKTSKAQSAPGLLSQAIITGNFIYTSGMIHLTPDGKLLSGTTAEKFKLVMNNLNEVLKAAGADFDDVVKVTIYVTDIAFVPVLNPIYKTYFREPFPAREAICIKALPLGADIEISMVAVKN